MGCSGKIFACSFAISFKKCRTLSKRIIKSTDSHQVINQLLFFNKDKNGSAQVADGFITLPDGRQLGYAAYGVPNGSPLSLRCASAPFIYSPRQCALIAAVRERAGCQQHQQFSLPSGAGLGEHGSKL